MSKRRWEDQGGYLPIKEMKKGETIIGEVLEIRKDVGFHGIFDIQLENGKKYSVWMNGVLRNRMRDINDGDIIKLTYKGRTLPTKKGNADDYLVQKATD